ncbi:hypothetical protein ABIB25_003836 [Nakamurella sp. UYEF19]|uniref:hypothetical protein n=1 Tax=Nakamurella sp. UYEF19 TaxID=1756392 RepID=UPI003390C4CB
MSERTLVDPITIAVGFMPRHRLLEALREGDVHLNEMASTLLDDAIFDAPQPESVTLVERSVSDLGLVAGAPLPQIFEAAQERGLQLCPPTTGPYLRLVLDSQAMAPDAVMSNGKAPSGSLTVAAPPFQVDEDYPKGFYLRVIRGRLWLRGYRCSSTEHVWDPADRLVFRSIGRNQGGTPGRSTRAHR